MVNEYQKNLLKTAGEDVFIHHDVMISKSQQVSVGNHVRIDSNFYLTPKAEIGSYIHIGPYVTAIGGDSVTLKIGNFVTISTGTKLICKSDSFSGSGLVTTPGIPQELINEYKAGGIIIEDFVNIGANAVIFPGITLGQGSVIGAGAIVTKDTKPWKFYMGVPAKPVKNRPKEKMLENAKKLGF